MSNKKTTKRALLLSVMSILLCVAMLVGTTFAWFTDSVTSGQNQILAGNLDVELYHTNSNVTDADVKSNTDLFVDKDGKAILWEPGVVAYENFTVANVGSLALKYQLNLTVFNEQKTPDNRSLSEVIKAAYVEGGVTGTDRDAIVSTIADDEWVKIADIADADNLLPGDKKTTGVVLYWEPTAEDDDFNLKNEWKDDPQLKIEFGIKLLATQLNSESDSFGTDYDMYAKYEDGSNAPNISVGTAEELKTALNNLVAGQSVTLTKDIDLTGADWEVSAPWNSSNTDVVFDGAGHKITGLTTSGNSYGGLFGRIATNGNMTIKNLKLENVSVAGTDTDGECAGGALIGWYESHGGVLTIENVEVNGVTATGFKYTGGLIGYINVNYAVNITDCTVNGTSVISSYNESGNYKGHLGGLVGYYGNGTITDCTVSDLTVKRADGANIATSSNRTGALVGTITANCTVASATVDNVTVDGAPASADNVFGPNASASSVSKANITIK